MNETLDYKANIGLVYSQAKRGFAWAQQASVPMDYEDAFQEASVAFVIAQRGFNPDAGVKFSTYYHRVAYSQFAKSIGRLTGVKRLNDDQRAEVAERDEENTRRRAAGVKELPSIQYGIGAIAFGDIGRKDAEGEDMPFEESLHSDCESPETIVETRQLMDRAMAQLSPLASLIVEWLRNPPEQLVEELQKQRAYADVADAAGVQTRTMRDGVSLANVKRFLALVGQVSERELVLAESELRSAVKYIEEAA